MCLFLDHHLDALAESLAWPVPAWMLNVCNRLSHVVDPRLLGASVGTDAMPLAPQKAVVLAKQI